MRKDREQALPSGLYTEGQTSLSLNSVLIPFLVTVGKYIAETIPWLKVYFGSWC